MNVQRLAELMERIPFNILLMAYLGYLGFGYYQFTTDPASPLQMKQQEIVASKDEINRLRQRVKGVQEFVQTLAVKKQELRAIAQELEATKASLTESLDVPELMNLLYTEAKRAGLSVGSLRPTQGHEQPFYFEQEFEFSSTGVYFQYITFLERVANLQKIIRISELNLAPSNSASSKYVQLNVAMKIKAYRYVRSAVDEQMRKAGGSS